MGSIGDVSRTASDGQFLGQSTFRFQRTTVGSDMREMDVADAARRRPAGARPPARPEGFGAVRTTAAAEHLIASERGRNLDVFA
ncbi:MAG: hypothetical protein HY722_06010 [Planctomycetes bacterium]|nr:hypothetical protein [Planctomycetota bacterium]